MCELGKAEANVAVAVTWRVAVTVRGPQVAAVVVPRATAQHTLAFDAWLPACIIAAPLRGVAGYRDESRLNQRAG